MPDGRGGYRRPSNPAPVSGPGAHSRRTDGGAMDLPDAAYGENKAFQEIQQGAPLKPASSAGSMPQITPLSASSTQPDVPVTDGSAYGPGAGMEAITSGQTPNQEDSEHLRKYLPLLIDIAQKDNTPPATRRWVRTIIANIS